MHIAHQGQLLSCLRAQEAEWLVESSSWHELGWDWNLGRQQSSNSSPCSTLPCLLPKPGGPLVHPGAPLRGPTPKGSHPRPPPQPIVHHSSPWSHCVPRARQASHKSHLGYERRSLSWVSVIIIVALLSTSSCQTRCLNRKEQPSCLQTGDQKQLAREAPLPPAPRGFQRFVGVRG